MPTALETSFMMDRAYVQSCVSLDFLWWDEYRVAYESCALCIDDFAAIWNFQLTYLEWSETHCSLVGECGSIQGQTFMAWGVVCVCRQTGFFLLTYVQIDRKAMFREALIRLNRDVHCIGLIQVKKRTKPLSCLEAHRVWTWGAPSYNQERHGGERFTPWQARG